MTMLIIYERANDNSSLLLISYAQAETHGKTLSTPF